MNPPIVVIHGNGLEHLTDAYKRFLEGRIREHFDLTGTPMRIEFKSPATTPSTRRSEPESLGAFPWRLRLSGLM
jgi:hypothetical protein